MLETLIPPAYEGETVAERLDAYSRDRARQVRLSFPTEIVGRMIEKDEQDELRLGDLKTPVRTFLKNATALDFELGQVPLNRFIQEHQDEVFQDIDLSEIDVPEDTSEEKAFEARLMVLTEKIKQLSRLYQITPTNEALTTLSNLGFTSAYDVTLFSPEVFVQEFGVPRSGSLRDRFSSPEEAQLIYRKAQQVSTVTQNLLIMAKQLDTSPALYVTSPSSEVREKAKQHLIQQYPQIGSLLGFSPPLLTIPENVPQELIKIPPTMESLLGSLDFCECEHCRSVLSPAAYFVDLLQFLDPTADSKSTTWKTFCDSWKKQHEYAPYPFKNKVRVKQSRNKLPFLKKRASTNGGGVNGYLCSCS